MEIKLRKIPRRFVYPHTILVGIFTLVLLFISHNSLLHFMPELFLCEFLPAVWVGVILLINSFDSSIFKSKIGNISLLLAFSLIALALFNKYTNREIDFLMFVNSLILPIIIALSLGRVEFSIDFQARLKIKKIIISFLIVNSIWAILERLLLYHLIPYVNTATEWIDKNDYFRSSALWGHGLANSLVTTIIMLFVLFDESEKISKRLKLYTLGTIALICFNSRFFLLYSVVIFIVYVLYVIFINKAHKNVQQRKLLIILSILYLISFIIVVFYWGLSSRLTQMGIYDAESSAARIVIFDIFKYYSWNDFLFGINHSNVAIIMHSAGLNVINENVWIIFMMRFGLIPLLLILLVYFYFFKIVFRKYRRSHALFICTSLLICISTFNSITTREGYLAIFTLSAFVFQPTNKKIIL